MFFEVELFRQVLVPAEMLDKDSQVALRELLKNLLLEKASKDHGYFLAVTTVNYMATGQVIDGECLVDIKFSCRTFIPCKNDILEGVVHNVQAIGVLLRCGPCEFFFLSARKMPNFKYDKGVFVSDDSKKIKKGVMVRFKVLAVKWVENSQTMDNEFKVLASIDGDSLGPV